MSQQFYETTPKGVISTPPIHDLEHAIYRRARPCPVLPPPQYTTWNMRSTGAPGLARVGVKLGLEPPPRPGPPPPPPSSLAPPWQE